jgi:hypothetical protein
MINRFRELPVILYSLFIIIWGIYKYQYYAEPNFMVMIIIFFIIMFLNNILIVATRFKNILQYISEKTRKFEIIFIILMILYLLISIIINVLIYSRKYDENAIPMEYFTFILLACSISGYNCFIFIKGLRNKIK